MYALTFNLSWASQRGIAVGSEADFVRACQSAERDCFTNALSTLKTLKEKVDVAGFQEVELADAIPQLRNSLPRLDSAYRACVWNYDLNKMISSVVMWNSTTLGPSIWSSTFDLDVGRPVGMVVTKSSSGRRYLLIVAHFPWLDSESKLSTMERAISAHMPLAKILGSDFVPIVMADTNDLTTLIHSARPLRLRNTSVHQGLDRKAIRRKLKTCCWHEEGHQYGHLTDTGDYVLSTSVERQYVPRAFARHRDDAFASDHLPVLALLTP